jgi:hypothetical protein
LAAHEIAPLDSVWPVLPWYTLVRVAVHRRQGLPADSFRGADGSQRTGIALADKGAPVEGMGVLDRVRHLVIAQSGRPRLTGQTRQKGQKGGWSSTRE